MQLQDNNCALCLLHLKYLYSEIEQYGIQQFRSMFIGFGEAWTFG